MSEDEQNPAPPVEEIHPLPTPDEPAPPEPMPEPEEHPVMLAVKDHLYTVINEALESIPPGIEADFDAILSHIKAHI